MAIQVTDGKGNRTNDTIQAVRCIPLDFDGKLPTQYHLEPTMIVESSPDKGHAYWVLSEPVELTKADYKEYVNRLCVSYGAEAGADNQCSDLARVLRLPGTYNRKPDYATDTGEAPLVKLAASSGKRYTVDEIMEGIPELDKPVSKSKADRPATQNNLSVLANANFSTTLAYYATQLRQAKEGERNSTLNKLKFTLAGAFPDKLAEIDESLTEAALDIGLSEAEIEATLASADKGTEKPITLVAGGKRSKGNQMRQTLEQFFGDYLQWDEMQNKLRFRGQHVSIEKLHDVCERELDRDLPFESFCRVASVISQDNPYHAARAYLQSLTVATNPEPILSALYQAMGVTSKLHRLYVRKWLISAVARVMQPGCKADNALVLQGNQGIGKTTFFSSLFGEFFQTVGEHKSDVDQLLAMTRSWCVEMGEIENAFSKKAVAAIKSFLSTQSDIFRRPYARESETFARHFVICGTTNQSEFLTDSTGNRRFWVIDLKQQVNVDAVDDMRDYVWSAVLKLYLDGEQWWLAKSEAKKAAEDTAQYEQENPWTEKISAYMSHHNPCTLADIMEHALGFDISRLNDKKAQMDVAAVLVKLGAAKKRLGVKKVTHWELPGLEGVTSDDIRTTQECEQYEEVF